MTHPEDTLTLLVSRRGAERVAAILSIATGEAEPSVQRDLHLVILTITAALNGSDQHEATHAAVVR